MIYWNLNCKGNDRCHSLYTKTGNGLFLDLFRQGWCMGLESNIEDVKEICKHNFAELDREEELKELNKELGWDK